jgi:hypothetical protein
LIQQGATVGARLEKLGQLWRRVKPYLLGFLVVLAVAGAILAIYYVPKLQVPVCPPGQDGLPPKICFDIENEARKTLAYILGGILAIIGIYMAHRRIRALERQVLVAQEGQITERFTQAIEQLGSKEIAIRIGGIYALERIAWDSDIDYWPIMETLTAYVRERAPWREPPPEESGGGSGEEAATPEAAATEVLAARTPATHLQGIFTALLMTTTHKPATDLQAILTVLGRRKYQFEQGETQDLDLRGTDLRGAEFRGANLVGADLMGAHLERANLYEANLEGAKLYETHLEGADLRKATGLTREQLAQAIIDEKTQLPDYLQEQPPKGKGPKGNDEE